MGLGCEDAQITHLAAHEVLPMHGDGGVSGLGPIPSLVIQDRGGIRKTVDAGVAALRELLPDADRARREEVPASSLVFGTNCGGSDAFSGITANPAVGAAADLVVATTSTVSPESQQRGQALQWIRNHAYAAALKRAQAEAR